LLCAIDMPFLLAIVDHLRVYRIRVDVAPMIFSAPRRWHSGWPQTLWSGRSLEGVNERWQGWQQRQGQAR
jgi:hypothetical protein